MTKRWLIFTSIFLIPATTWAQSWKVLGTRPLGMGGAHVAVAEGAIAQYWNPAGLAVQKGFDLEIPVGGGVEFTKDILREADEVSNLVDKIDDIQNKTDVSALNLTEYEDFLNAINEIQDLNRSGLGLVAEAQGGVNVRLRRYAFSVNTFAEVGADPFVDTVNVALEGGDFGAGIDAAADFNGGGVGGNANPAGLADDETQLATIITDLSAQVGIQLPASAANVANELVAQAVAQGQTEAQIADAIDQIDSLADEAAPFLPSISNANSFENNQTNLTVTGAAITEAAFGLGTPVPFIGDLPILNRLSLGANVKYLQGYVGYAKLVVVDEDAEISDIVDEYDRYNTKSSNVGLDLGALYDMKDTFLRSRFGLVMRNINKPTFDQPAIAKADGIQDFTLYPQVRAGYAFYPLSWIVLAADLDLTNNITQLSGYHSRMASLGAEFNLINKSWLNLALRGGLMKNIAEDAALAYTAGFGLNIFHLHIDLGAAISSETVQIEDADEVPTSARAALNIGLKF